MSLVPHELSHNDHHLLAMLRHMRAQARHAASKERTATLGTHVADTVAAVVGSWRFIVIQSVLLVIWMVLNVVGWIRAWDPYPFILLNLALSFQAAYTAPIIMMSQNRQSDIDREKAKEDYDVNLKAELEIELLHQKIDLLRETEILQLTQLIEKLSNTLDQR